MLGNGASSRADAWIVRSPRRSASDVVGRHYREERWIRELGANVRPKRHVRVGGVRAVSEQAKGFGIRGSFASLRPSIVVGLIGLTVGYAAHVVRAEGVPTGPAMYYSGVLEEEGNVVDGSRAMK